MDLYLAYNSIAVCGQPKWKSWSVTAVLVEGGMNAGLLGPEGGNTLVERTRGFAPSYVFP